jgi:hypothetical protein
VSLRVTKFLPGEQIITFASVIFIRSKPQCRAACHARKAILSSGRGIVGSEKTSV